MYLEFLIIILPVLVYCIFYDLLLWVVSVCFSIVLWVHDPLSFHHTGAIDPIDIIIGSLSVIIFLLFYHAFLSLGQ